MSRRRILIVSGRPTWPPWRGDQLRTRQWVAALHRDNDVTVLSPPSIQPPDYSGWPGVRHITFNPSPTPMRGLRAVGALARGLPAQCGLYHYPDLGRLLRKLSPEHDGTVLLLARLALHAEDLASDNTQGPWIADLVDALSLSFHRRAAFDRPWLRPLWELESRFLSRAESRLIEQATRTVVVSKRDSDYLRSELDAAADRLDVVPVALPVMRLDDPVEATPVSPTDGPATLAFTGNLGYFVNRDALTWWLREVWPRLTTEHPQLRLLVAGDRPARSLRRLVEAHGGELVARPADLRGLLSRCTLAIAPLRAGAGMPLKILDAWSVGVPVVASTWAAAGVDAVPDRELLVADSPEEWAQTVGHLLQEARSRQQLSAGGVDALESRFGRDVVLNGLRTVVDQALAKPR